MSMRTRNNKNNLSQSKTNNESNNLTNYTNRNDINLYLNKYILKKKKTRNRNDYAFLNKKTFNLSSQKYDINGSSTVLNNSNLPNFKNINLSKNIFIKSRNKIPSCFKGRPNTIFNKSNLLINKIQKRKFEKKIRKENNSNLIVKKRNYSMIGYGNVININLNSLNHNLTERENNSNIKEYKMNNNNNKNCNISNNKNKSPDDNYKKSRHNKVLSGLYINLSNLEHLSKKEINSERNINMKNKHNRNMSQNKTNSGISSIFLKNNLLNRTNKTKLSFISSNSVSKSKSKSKKKSKISHFQMIKTKTKSFFTNSLKTLLIEDISKWKKISKKSNNIVESKKNKKISKEINTNYIQKKVINNQKNNFNGNNSNYINDNNVISMNNNDQSSCAVTSRTRNLKTYNILFKTNSIEIDKNKISDINNKENHSINRKVNSNNMISNKTNLKNSNNIKNSFGNNHEYSKIGYMKKIAKKNIVKNYTEKTLHDSYFVINNGGKKYNKKYKK